MSKSYDAKLTSKGQVTIPVAIRNALKLDFGNRISFTIEDDNQVFISKKEDILLERILFMLSKLKKDGTLFIIYGSDEESRRQFLLELIGTEYDEKYAITNRENHYLPNDFIIRETNYLNAYDWTNDFNEDEENDRQYGYSKRAFLFWEEIPYSLLLSSMEQSGDIFLTIDEYRVQELINNVKQNLEEVDYSFRISSYNNILEIGLDTSGMHTLTYYSLKDWEIEETQKLY